MNTNLQQQMFLEMTDKHIFDQAQQYAYEYIENIFDRNVYPTEKALADLSVFDEVLPDGSSKAEDIIGQLHQYGSPATVANMAGRYFGFVTGGAVPVGLAAKTLGTYWDQATPMQVLSPIGSKLESVVEGWLKDLFALPEYTVAGFVSGTSSANLCGLLAARFRMLERQGWNINEKGLFGAPKIRVVAGKQAHSTVLKAISLIGFGTANIEWVEVDDQGRMRPDHVPELDEHTIVILQAGNVNSGSFDPFDEICTKANKAGAWVHIDGAFGLWAGAVERLKHLTGGIEKATSWAVDGHKTLNTPYDSGIIMCADEEALVTALHMSGSYIVEGKDRDGMFYTPEMSRRARIVELWAILKYLGRKGIDEMVDGMCQRARQFADEISRTQGFQVLNEVVFNQVLVCCGSDALTVATMKKVQDLRTCWAGGSVWHGRKVIRVSVCSWATTEEDVTRSVESFKKALDLVLDNHS